MKSHYPGARGFTLVELVIVMVLVGVLAGSMVMFLRPAIMNYLAVVRRANVSSMTDGAARTITTEIRTAVPNSLRMAGGQCLEFVPTSDGGRFRTGPDTSTAGSAWMDLSQPAAAFDVLTPFTTLPVAGDFVVIGNQSPDDVYARRNLAAISTVTLPPAPALGTRRITLATPFQFPTGYEGGRFVIVPQRKQAVTYRCENVGMNTATGTGTGSLLRYSNYGFNATAVCPPAGVGAVIATKVSRCIFDYTPNEGATQQSGYVQVRLGISDNGEAADLVFGAHVDNAP